MRGVRSNLLPLGALVALLTACGSSSQETPRIELQNSLRALASSAPAGDHAYWLGSEFEGAPVTFADASWARYAVLTYRADNVGIDLDVESFRAGEDDESSPSRVRTRTATGQDVVLVFHVPARPNSALLRAAKAALVPIPPRLRYP
jgi:hypothetical protein